MRTYTAAQIMVIVEALREHDPEAEKKRVAKGLKAQPRVSRNVLLELARKNNPDVKDIKELT
jgi:hypothetical protein